jgi:hypothetical protein
MHDFIVASAGFIAGMMALVFAIYLGTKAAGGGDDVGD